MPNRLELNRIRLLKKMIMQDRILTPEQVGEKLQLHPFTILNYIKDGRLRGAKIGRVYRIRESDIEKFLDSQMLTTPWSPIASNAAKPSRRNRSTARIVKSWTRRARCSNKNITKKAGSWVYWSHFLNELSSQTQRVKQSRKKIIMLKIFKIAPRKWMDEQKVVYRRTGHTRIEASDGRVLCSPRPGERIFVDGRGNGFLFAWRFHPSSPPPLCHSCETCPRPDQETGTQNTKE